MHASRSPQVASIAVVISESAVVRETPFPSVPMSSVALEINMAAMAHDAAWNNPPPSQRKLTVLDRFIDTNPNSCDANGPHAKKKDVHMWKLEVAGCFGDIDIIFAVHPLDKQRAITCIDDAKADGAAYDDFAKEVVWYCYQHVIEDLKSYIDAQLERLKLLWS